MISCKALQKKYGKHTILQDVTFEVSEPKIIGLIGRNGVGKSTLLRLLAGHVKPTSGSVQIFGKKAFQNLTVAANTMFIEDHMTFPGTLTLEEILKVATKFYPNFALDLALELVKFSGITLNQHHHELSKGQKAAFQLIYGISSRSALTLLDEPMNGMDETIRDDMYRMMLKDFLAYPRIIIISSHYLNEMEHLIEDILLLHEGSVELFAPVDEVQSLAVKLIGQKENMEAHLHEWDVLLTRDNGPMFEAIVRAGEFVLPANVRMQSLTASDVCKVLTATKGGSIDDIYRDSAPGA